MSTTTKDSDSKKEFTLPPEFTPFEKKDSEKLPLADDNSGNFFENHPGGNPPPIVKPDLTKNPATNVDDKDYDPDLDPLRDANKLRKRLEKNEEARPSHNIPNQAINFPSQVNTRPQGSIVTEEEKKKIEGENKKAVATATSNAIKEIKGEPVKQDSVGGVSALSGEKIIPGATVIVKTPDTSEVKKSEKK